MQKAENVERSWYVIDAAGHSLGHTAVQVAIVLRGKHKPEYTPHVDGGDFVVVVNAEKAVLTGRKLEQKVYRTHSGYVGGLKETKYRLLMQNRPELAMHLAVKGMMPKNSLGRWALKRLRVYKGVEHPHAAQKPVVWEVPAHV